MSNFLPGHGGILDRIDGILIGIPVGLISLILFSDGKVYINLGSTGSIGSSVLKLLIKKFFKVNLLAANKNYKKILNQIKKYKLIFLINDKIW